ncbi:MAG TPA: type I restriction-modification system subunit M N-terminal domain-containing protein [Myxococcales bacterium]|nr:type I restriction-modification system subunit M N-terminal domain-containing protein [Myxococcales bacterium]
MERQFWTEIDALGSGIDPPEFRRLVTGLVFLRYLDESFSDHRAWLDSESRDARSVYFCLDADRDQLLSRPDVYHASSIAFIVPAARWERLRLAASLAPINLGRTVDAMMISVVSSNPRLEGIFPDDYSRPTLSREALAGAINAVSRIALPFELSAAAASSSSDDIHTTADALKLICQGFLAEASPDTPGPNRLRVRTPISVSAPEYSTAIARLDRQLQELSRLLGRSPRSDGGGQENEGGE